jgi:hypothetical protein
LTTKDNIHNTNEDRTTRRHDFVSAVCGMEECRMIISKNSAHFLNSVFDEHTDPTEINSTKRFHPTAGRIKKVLDEIDVNPYDCQLIRIEETSNLLAVPPHTDAPTGYESIIVPLRFIGDVHTILYRSLYLGKGNDKGYKYRPSRNKYYKDEWLSGEDEILSNLSNKPFTNKKYQSLLSYLPKEDLFGLRIEKIFSWKERKLIKFRSNQLHSGSNFHGKKRWLLIIKKNA